MPSGGTWEGVYVSKSHGVLNVVVSDRRADGVWRTRDGVRGSLWGAVEGNTLRYQWSERRKNARGEPVAWFGRGYFVYRVVNGKTHLINGEWGLDVNEAGNAWNAVKRLGKKPRLDGTGDQEEGSEDEAQTPACYGSCEEEQDEPGEE
jgi:hypothetical protein